MILYTSVLVLVFVGPACATQQVPHELVLTVTPFGAAGSNCFPLDYRSATDFQNVLNKPFQWQTGGLYAGLVLTFNVDQFQDGGCNSKGSYIDKDSKEFSLFKKRLATCKFKLETESWTVTPDYSAALIKPGIHHYLLIRKVEKKPYGLRIQLLFASRSPKECETHYMCGPQEIIGELSIINSDCEITTLGNINEAQAVLIKTDAPQYVKFLTQFQSLLSNTQWICPVSIDDFLPKLVVNTLTQIMVKNEIPIDVASWLTGVIMRIFRIHVIEVALCVAVGLITIYLWRQYRKSGVKEPAK